MTHCPMHAAAQPACAMHEGALPDAEADRDEGRCMMRGVCSGPMATLAALMAQNGVLPDSTSLTFDGRTSPGASPADAYPIPRSSSPATPPPKSAFPAA